MPEPLLRHASAQVHGRYLVQPAPRGAARGWLVGFHGYAQSAAAFLPGLVAAAGEHDWLVASVQGLHPFYTKGEAVVAGWMTREDRELAIADNIRYTDSVCDALEHEFGAPRRIVFAGFSQGVAMAYRAAMRGRRTPAAIVAVGADVAPDVLDVTRAWPRVLMATGKQDAWYTPERLVTEAEQLRGRGADVRTLLHDGGHEWGGAVETEVAALLAELGAESG